MLCVRNPEKTWKSGLNERFQRLHGVRFGVVDMFLCGFVFININQIIVQVLLQVQGIFVVPCNLTDQHTRASRLSLILGLVSTPLVRYPCVGW